MVGLISEEPLVPLVWLEDQDAQSILIFYGSI
jgi:hypothetical protein